METIFDHNVTKEDLKRFGGEEYFEKAKKYGVDPYQTADSANYAIAQYLKKIKDYSLIQATWKEYGPKLLFSR